MIIIGTLCRLGGISVLHNVTECGQYVNTQVFFVIYKQINSKKSHSLSDRATAYVTLSQDLHWLPV